jgi:hypothetical protein
MDFAGGIERILNLNFPRLKKTIRYEVIKCAKRELSNKKKILQGEVPLEPIGTAISFICTRCGCWAALATKVGEQLEGRNPLDLLKKRA